jgi:hypothetical protein
MLLRAMQATKWEMKGAQKGQTMHVTAEEAIRAFIVYKGASQGAVVRQLMDLASRAVRVEPQGSGERGKISNLDNNIMNVCFLPALSHSTSICAAIPAAAQAERVQVALLLSAIQSPACVVCDRSFLLLIFPL